MTATLTTMICTGCGEDLTEVGVGVTEVTHYEDRLTWIEGEWVLTQHRNMGNLRPPEYVCGECGEALTEEQEQEVA